MTLPGIITYTGLLDQRERSLQIVEEDPGVPAPTPVLAEDGTTLPPRDGLAEQDHGRFSIVRNPLESGRSRFLTDSMGRRRECPNSPPLLDLTFSPGWLGPSSTWAYSRRVLSLIQEYLGQHESPDIPLNVDAQAIKLDWPSSREVIPQPTVDIPSLDYALYLTNTVKFHLGQTFHIFDEENFMRGLHEFYRKGPTQGLTTDTRIWHIQFLLVMAFGKALLVPGEPGKSPPGGALVSRALELLPDNQGLYQDPVLSMEILCCLALYLQSVDHRNSAFTYVRQVAMLPLRLFN